eukprot:c9084_g1_i1.p1 GENE.c9084_g1_i1~~c9084_g1_i1.p1  ORF type:complete len:529 (+),score=85.15 c9084_g1_i1:117-1703(+)
MKKSATTLPSPGPSYVRCVPEILGNLDTWRSPDCSAFQRCVPIEGLSVSENRDTQKPHYCSCEFADTLFSNPKTDPSLRLCHATTISNLQVGFWAICAMISTIIFIVVSVAVLRGYRARVLYNSKKPDFLGSFSLLVAATSFVFVLKCIVRALRLTPNWTSSQYATIEQLAIAADIFVLLMWTLTSLKFGITCLGVVSRTKKLTSSQILRYERFLICVGVVTEITMIAVVTPFWYYGLRVTIDLATGACCCGLLFVQGLVRYRVEQVIQSIPNMRPNLRLTFAYIHRANKHMVICTILQLIAACAYIGVYFAARGISTISQHNANVMTSYGLAVLAKVIFISLIVLQASLANLVISKLRLRIRDQGSVSKSISQETASDALKRKSENMRPMEDGVVKTSKQIQPATNEENGSSGSQFVLTNDSENASIIDGRGGQNVSIAKSLPAALVASSSKETQKTGADGSSPSRSGQDTSKTHETVSETIDTSVMVVVSSPNVAAIMMIPGSTRHHSSPSTSARDSTPSQQQTLA